MSNLSKNSSNPDIIQEYGSKIKTGNPVIYAVWQGKSPEHLVLGVIQKTAPKNADALFNNNNSHVRAIRTVKKEIAEDFPVGKVLPNMEIILTESYEPSYEEQSAVINPDTGQSVLYNGKEFYRTTSLEMKGQKTNTLISSVEVGEQVPSNTVATF